MRWGGHIIKQKGSIGTPVGTPEWTKQEWSGVVFLSEGGGRLDVGGIVQGGFLRRRKGKMGGS